MTVSIEKNIDALREQMELAHLDAYIITGTDPHQSEIPSEHWQSRAWISGFTGSAGMVVVTDTESGLWTDFRYYIQAEKELRGTPIRLYRSGEPDVPDPVRWLADKLPRAGRIGVCGQEISLEHFEALKTQIEAVEMLLITTEDLVDKVWIERPCIPDDPLVAIPTALCGESREDKIARIRRLALERYRADVQVISSLDDIAWVLNLRGTDVPYNPLFTAYLVVTGDAAALFVDEGKISRELSAHIGEAVQRYPYNAFFDTLAVLIPAGSRVLFSPEKSSVQLAFRLEELRDVNSVRGAVIASDLKARKNSVEIAGIRTVHRQDGAAVTQFIHWFYDKGSNGISCMDEVMVAETLLGFRRRRAGFLRESFATIAAFGANGALCHYSADRNSPAEINGDGLLVLDSGGHYTGGTTDITRTLYVGRPTEQQKREYTLVLRGHLALKHQRFPEGTRGYQLDVLARKPLWDEGLDYGHGTGHGIGFMLNVHEGPQSISPKPIDVALQPGMVVSDEPGLYREGAFGIRIENLLVVIEDEKTEFGRFLAFEDLTRVPYERDLIEPALLNEREIAQVNAYHQQVFADIGDLLQEEERVWLEMMCAPLG